MRRWCESICGNNVRARTFFSIVITSSIPARRDGSQVFIFAMQSQRKRRDFFYKLNIHTIMKEMIDILMSEDKSFEGLPKWVYIFAIPAGLVLMCMIGGTLS